MVGGGGGASCVYVGGKDVLVWTVVCVHQKKPLRFLLVGLEVFLALSDIVLLLPGSVM